MNRISLATTYWIRPESTQTERENILREAESRVAGAVAGEVAGRLKVTHRGSPGEMRLPSYLREGSQVRTAEATVYILTEDEMQELLSRRGRCRKRR